MRKVVGRRDGQTDGRVVQYHNIRPDLGGGGGGIRSNFHLFVSI
jgi:hypothetical protein